MNPLGSPESRYIYRTTVRLVLGPVVSVFELACCGLASVFLTQCLSAPASDQSMSTSPCRNTTIHHLQNLLNGSHLSGWDALPGKIMLCCSLPPQPCMGLDASLRQVADFDRLATKNTQPPHRPMATRSSVECSVQRIENLFW